MIGVVSTVVSAAYYLAVVRSMFLRDSVELRLAPAGGSPPRELVLGTGVGDRGRRHGRLVLRRAAARRRGAGRRERAPVLTKQVCARALYGLAGESEPSRRQCGASANAALSANSATAASSDDTARGGTPWTALERTAQESTSSATIRP